MARLPRMSGRRVAKVFQHLGWEIARHENHIVIVQDGGWHALVFVGMCGATSRCPRRKIVEGMPRDRNLDVAKSLAADSLVLARR
jgi:hypothetical protein